MPPRHRPPDLALRADRDAVHPGHRTDAERGRGEEHLVGIVGIVEIDIGLAQRQPLLAREIDRGLAADPGQHEFFPRRQDLVSAHDENVRAEPFGKIAVDVEQHRPGFRIDALHLLIGDDQVEIVVRLGARGERIRRHAALRRHHDLDALLEQLGALGERQRLAFEHDVRPVIVDVVARHFLDAAADALPDPVVVVRPEQVAVALEHLLGQLAHLLRAEARIDAQIFERAVEPVDMLLHLEQPVAEGAGHVEAAVAVDPARVAERDAHLALGHEFAVEPGYPFVRQLGHLPLRETLSVTANDQRRPARQPEVAQAGNP